MTTISDQTKKIFELLRNDADFPSEEDALKEADKRAKQHDRNNQALSLALSEEPSPAINDLLSFLNLEKAPRKKRKPTKKKADADETNIIYGVDISDRPDLEIDGETVDSNGQIRIDIHDVIEYLKFSMEKKKLGTPSNTKKLNSIAKRVGKGRAERVFARGGKRHDIYEDLLNELEAFAKGPLGLRKDAPPPNRISSTAPGREIGARSTSRRRPRVIRSTTGKPKTEAKTRATTGRGRRKAPKGEGDSSVKNLKGVRAVRAAARKGQGIDTLRPQGRLSSKFRHYGNPFRLRFGKTHTKKQVQDSVDNFISWLKGDIDAEDSWDTDKQRDWILDQIDSGELDGKTLLYYTDEHAQSHADALSEFANARRAGGTTPKSSTPKRPKRAAKKTIPPEERPATKTARKKRTTRKPPTVVSENDDFVEGEVDIQQHTEEGYPPRTIKNVQQSDATLIFKYNNSRGIRATIKAAEENEMPYHVIDVSKGLDALEDGEIQEIVEFLDDNQATDINIAGNDITSKGLPAQDEVDDFTWDALSRVLGDVTAPIEHIRSGGQSGFDQAGIQAARQLEIPSSILFPKGYMTRIKGNRGKPRDITATLEEAAAVYSGDFGSRQGSVASQTPEEVEAIRREVDPSVEGRERREAKTSPLDYVDEYVTTLQDGNSLINRQSNIFNYYPHLDRFAELTGYLQKTTTSGRGRKRRTKTDALYGTKAEATKLVFNQLQQLQKLEQLERDFTLQRDSGTDNFSLYAYVEKMPHFQKDIRANIRDTIWERFERGERVTNSDVEALFSVIQNMRVATANDLSQNLKGTSLNKAWRDKIPDADIKYGEQAERLFRRGGRRKSRRNLAREEADNLAWGNADLDMVGLVTTLKNSLPEDTNSDSYRNLLTVYNHSKRYGFNTFNRLMEQAGGTEGQMVGITFSEDLRDMLQTLPVEVRSDINEKFMREPSKFSTDDSFQRLIDTAIESHEARIKRTSAGEKKQLRFFMNYQLPMGVRTEKFAVTDTPEAEVAALEEFDPGTSADLGVIEGEPDLEIDEVEAETDADVAGLQDEAVEDEATEEDIESYDIKEPKVEDDDGDEVVETSEEFDEDMGAVGNEVSNLPTILPTGHKYSKHLDKAFQNSLQTIADKLFGLDETRKGIKATGTFPAVADVYIADALAQAYLGVEGHSEIKKNTPINIKVRTITKAGAKQVKELAKDFKKIGGHKVNIKVHVSDTPASNDDEHQVLFWNDRILEDMGDMGTKGVSKQHRADPFNVSAEGRFPSLSDETLTTSLPTLRKQNRFRYRRTYHKPSEEEARRLTELLPEYQRKYAAIRDEWEGTAAHLWKDKDGNDVLDEKGRPLSADAMITRSIALREDYDKPGGQAEAIRNSGSKMADELIESHRKRLDDQVTKARNHLMEGNILHKESDAYKALDKAGMLGTGKFAPEELPNNRVHIRGFRHALRLARDERDRDIQELVTGLDSKGNQLAIERDDTGDVIQNESTGLLHEWEDDEHLGIPNIRLDIQLANPPAEEGGELEWVTVGHLLPDWQHMGSMNREQFQSKEDLEDMHYKVFHPDKQGNPSIGNWDEVTHDTGLVNRSWSWDIDSGINENTGESWKNHHLSVGTVEGDNIADDAGLEKISHTPGIGLDLGSAVTQPTGINQGRYNRLRKLSAKALQLFRPAYSQVARTWTKTKSGAAAPIVNRLLEDAGRGQRRGSLSASISFSIDNPSIYDIVQDEYTAGKRLNSSDYTKLLKYGLQLKDAYEEVAEVAEEGEPIYISQLDVETPVQFVDGEEIPLLSTPDIQAFAKSFLDTFVRTENLDERVQKSNAQHFAAMEQLGDIDLFPTSSPFLRMAAAYHKFKNADEYANYISAASTDLPDSFFNQYQSSLRNNIQRNYTKYRAIAELLGHDESETPVRELFHRMHLLDVDSEGNPIRFSQSTGAGLQLNTLSMEDLLNDKLATWATTVVEETSDPDVEGPITYSTTGKDSTATILTKNDKGELVLKQLGLASDTHPKRVGKIVEKGKVLSNRSVLEKLGWKEINVEASHKKIQSELAGLSRFILDKRDSLNAMNADTLAEYLEEIGVDSKEDALEVLYRYSVNLRRVDSGFVDLPRRFYVGSDAKAWMNNKERAAHQRQVMEFLDDRVDALLNVQPTFDAVEVIDPTAQSPYTQHDYEYRYLQALGRSIANPHISEDIVTKAFSAMKNIRQRVRDSSRDDFVAVENPEEVANNSINVMLNMLGNVWFRQDADYLASQEYANAVSKNKNWWDDPLRDKDSIQIAGRGQRAGVNVSKRGLLMNLETPEPMWHDDLLFDTNQFEKKPPIGKGLQLIPRTSNMSEIYDPKTETIVGFTQREEKGWGVFTSSGERVLAGTIRKGQVENTIRNKPTHVGNDVITAEDGELEVENVQNPAENSGLRTPDDEIQRFLSGPLRTQMEANEWSDEVLRTIFDEINAERAEKGQNPLKQLNVTHLNEDSYNLSQRVADKVAALKTGEEKLPIENENEAVITMHTKAQNTRTIKNFRERVRQHSTNFGLDFAGTLFAKEAITIDGVKYNKNAALPGWKHLEDFMKTQEFLGANETLFNTSRKGVTTLNAETLGDKARIIHTFLTGHSSLEPEENEAAQAFLSETLGLKLTRKYLKKRENYRAGTPTEQVAPTTRTRRPRRERQPEQPKIDPRDVDLENVAPPRMSRGAVQALKNAGLPIDDALIERMGVSRPENPRTEGAYMDEMYVALPDEDGNLEPNPNFLGLSEHPDLIALFSNLLTSDGTHNYPFDARPLEGTGENQVGRITSPARNSVFQGENVFTSEFTTIDANAFIESVLHGDEESVGAYFQSEELEGISPDELETIRSAYTTPQPERGGGGQPLELQDTYTDRYGRPFASSQTMDVETEEVVRRGKRKGKRKTVSQTTFLDGKGNPFDDRVMDKVFGGLLDETGATSDIDAVLAILDKLTPREMEALRYKSLNEREQQEELIIISEYGPDYMDEYVKADITDDIDPTTMGGFIADIRSMEKTAFTNTLKFAREKLEFTGGQGKSREELEDEFRTAYNDANKVQLPENYFEGKTGKQVLDATKKLREQTITLEEKQVSEAYKQAANDLSNLQVPTSQHPLIMEQFARRLLMHEQLFSEATDKDGNPYMEDETIQFITAYRDQLNQLFPELVEKIAKEAEELGEDLTEDGLPKIDQLITQKDEEIKAMKADDDAYKEYVQNTADASMLTQHGQLLIGQAPDGSTVRMSYDGRGMPQEEVSPDIRIDADFQAPNVLGLSPEMQQLWEKYHRTKLVVNDSSKARAFSEREHALWQEEAAGLYAFRDALEEEYNNIFERKETPAEEEARTKAENSPLNVLRDMVRPGGAFRPSYWKKPSPTALDVEALQQLANEYNIPPDSAKQLIDHAESVASEVSKFKHPLVLPPYLQTRGSINDYIRQDVLENGIQVNLQDLQILEVRLTNENDKVYEALMADKFKPLRGWRDAATDYSSITPEIQKEFDDLNERYTTLNELLSLRDGWASEVEEATKAQIFMRGGYRNIDDMVEQAELSYEEAVRPFAEERVQYEQAQYQFEDEAAAMEATLIAALEKEYSTEDSEGNRIPPTDEKKQEIASWVTEQLGLTAMQRLMAGTDSETGFPVDEDGNIIEPPVEGLLYSPILHAWVNTEVLRDIFSGLDTDKTMYIANYAELRRQEEGIDENSPESQAFIPVTGTERQSPLQTNRDLVLHPRYGWIPLTDINTVRNRQSGPFSADDIVSTAISDGLSRDIEQNRQNYQNKEGLPYSITELNIDDNLQVTSVNPDQLPPAVVDKIAPVPRERGFLEEGGTAAKFLAGIRGRSSDAGAVASVSQQLIMGTKDFLNTPFGLKTMSLGFIIPISQSMRFQDDTEKELTNQQKVREYTNKKLSRLSMKTTPESERLKAKDGNFYTPEQIQIGLQEHSRKRIQEGLPPLTTQDVQAFMTATFSPKELAKPSIARLKTPIYPELQDPQTPVSAIDRLQQFASGQFKPAPIPLTPEEQQRQSVSEAFKNLQESNRFKREQAKLAEANIQVPPVESV